MPVYRPPADRPSEPQTYQCLLSHFIQVEYFFKFTAGKLLVFKWSQAQEFFLKKSYEICCGRDLSYLKLQAGKTDVLHFSHHSHALVTLDVQFLCFDWSKFDRWVHAENLYSILKLVYFDSWGWQSFVSTCDVFNCLFPLDVQNEIQLLSRVFCYSWLVCFLNFWLRNAPLVKVGNPITDGIVFVFHLAGWVWGLKSLKRFWPYLIAFRSCISKYGKPE